MEKSLKTNVGARPVCAQKGITLIALVITIIVMLILVAVTITVAVNGGLFDYARKAAVDTNTAIRDEQNLADVEEGKTYEELIAKYTKENPDLAKLRKYYIDGDDTAIPNADEDITYLAEGEESVDDGEGGEHIFVSYIVIQYNDLIYRILNNYDNIAQNVEEITGEAITIMKSGTEIANTGTGTWFYNYQNEIYKVTIDKTSTTTSILGDDEVAVVCKRNKNWYISGGYIQFTPKQGQKWYQWAEDEDFADGDLKLDLKALITRINNEEDDKTIQFLRKQGKRGMTFRLCNNGVPCKTNSDSTDSDIIPHTVYAF